MPKTEIPDYYELLEISPKATQETIHRVYRYMSARYHPDVVGTGNLEKFNQITSAHKSSLRILIRRSEYDVAASDASTSDSKSDVEHRIDFMDQVEGDWNRRLAVLAILYYRRRMNPNSAEVTLNGNRTANTGFRTQIS